MAKYFILDPEHIRMRIIDQAAEIIRNGGIVAYPTDTNYGFGCDIFNKKAIERVYWLKNKDPKQPLSFVCADLKDLSRYAVVENFAFKLMQRLLPGPYTFVLRATKLVPRLMLTQRKTVGIRVPDNPIALAIVKTLGHPIVNTSVRLHGSGIFTDPQEIRLQFGSEVDAVIDGGIIVSEPSTVVEMMSSPPEVLRYGKGETHWFE